MVRWKVSNKGSEALIVDSKVEDLDSYTVQSIPSLHITNNDERARGYGMMPRMRPLTQFKKNLSKPWSHRLMVRRDDKGCAEK